MNKIYLYPLSVFLLVSFAESASCVTFSCDPSISYAMGKQRTALKNRLADYKNTIKATRESMVVANKICALEAYELLRLKQRKRIETYKQAEINHYGETVKSQSETITQ